nr:(+)-neomenthol dehydrogenase [Quercus suber]
MVQLITGLRIDPRSYCLSFLQIDGTIRSTPLIYFLKEKIPNEWAKEVLGDAESLTEERVDEVLNEYLKDFKEDSLETKGWPRYSSPYIISKAAMNACTRIVAKKYPSFRVNCVCPGYVKTDINYNNGYLTTDEGAESVVKYAIVTGANKGIGFGICRKLASNGIMVVLIARDEKKGLKAIEKLRESGLSDHVVFHQLDVADYASISSLAGLIKTKYGKLDILVSLKMFLVLKRAI